MIDVGSDSAGPPRVTPASAFVMLPGAVGAQGLDEGVAAHYGDPMGEQRALAAGFAIVDQSHLAIVTVTGQDRLSWLHSLTTQHLSALAPGEPTELLVLSPHGHIEHQARVVDDGAATWLISESSDGPALAAWLDSMRFMMRVEVADRSSELAAIGWVGDGTAELAGLSPEIVWSDPWPGVLAGGTSYTTLPDAEHPGHELAWRLGVVPREAASALADRAVASGGRLDIGGVRLAGSWAAEALRIAAWRPRFGAEVDHKSLPSELDWLRTAVHLDKGCYRGQESVARINNLGKPPRRLVKLDLDGSGHLLPPAGAQVVADSDSGQPGREVGTLTSSALHFIEGPIGLALIKRGVDPAAELSVIDGTVGEVAASQETIVTPSGESDSRPAARPQVGGMREARPPRPH